MKKQAFIKSFCNLQCHLKDFFHLYSLCITEREMMHDIIQSKSMAIYHNILDFCYFYFLFTDVASKMAQLENAFKKYQVEEAECEMYIACEASQVHRHEENGPLAKIVYDILR